MVDGGRFAPRQQCVLVSLYESQCPLPLEGERGRVGGCDLNAIHPPLTLTPKGEGTNGWTLISQPIIAIAKFMPFFALRLQLILPELDKRLLKRQHFDFNLYLSRLQIFGYSSLLPTNPRSGVIHLAVNYKNATNVFFSALPAAQVRS